MRDTRVTIEATAEELEYKGTFADADISVTLTLSPPERPTRHYPGHPGCVSINDWTVNSYVIYDKDGNPAEEGNDLEHCPAWLVCEIDKWVHVKNDQRLIEEACEKADELNDPYNYI